MKRFARLLAIFALPVAFAAPASAATRTYFGFQIGVSNVPQRRVVFYDEPRVRVIPGESVYYIDDDRYDYDMFRCGSDWYLFDDGYWYRARNYRGPFRAVDVRYVPRRVLYVPASHWKHRYATRTYDRPYDRAHDRNYDRGRAYDRGGMYDRGQTSDHGRTYDRGRTDDRDQSWSRGRSHDNRRHKSDGRVANRDRGGKHDRGRHGNRDRDRDRD